MSQYYKEKYWNRCDICGKYISIADFDSKKAKRTISYDYYGSEVYDTFCKKHNPDKKKKKNKITFFRKDGIMKKPVFLLMLLMAIIEEEYKNNNKSEAKNERN